MAASSGKGPFWLGWKLSASSQDAWKKWSTDNNVPLMSVSELHCTEFYAPNAPEDKAWPPTIEAAFTVRPNGIARLGNALVILFDAPQFVTARFLQLQSDYEHSFASFIPHMSLFYMDKDREDEDKDTLGNDQMIAGLNAKIQDMPALTFQNQEINMPKEAVDKAALLYMENCGLYDTAKHKHTDDPRSEFLSAFGKALSANPDLIDNWKSGDKDVYRSSWVKVLRVMSSEKV